MRNLLSSKVIDVQFTNLSDVRIVDSISESLPKLFALRSARVSSSSWCNPNGCLRVVGKLIFSFDCLWKCQRRKLNTLQESNSIKTPININLNSIFNTVYQIELDAFTIVISTGPVEGDQLKMLLMYQLTGSTSRADSSLGIPVDNSSLINVTRLVANSVAQAELDIFNFTVLQAEVIIGSNVLNITVLFTFINTCTTTCQQTQVFKLKNANSIASVPITIIYDDKIHVHNVTLAEVIVVVSTTTTVATPLLTTEGTITPSDMNTRTTFRPGPINTKSTFVAEYVLMSFDLTSEVDVEIGPITNNVTLESLTQMMQNAVPNDTNITVMVINATIKLDQEDRTAIMVNFGQSSYVLRLIVDYIYEMACKECARISNESVHSKPVLLKQIRIGNAFLINISRPVTVIEISSVTIMMTSPETSLQVTGMSTTFAMYPNNSSKNTHRTETISKSSPFELTTISNTHKTSPISAHVTSTSSFHTSTHTIHTSHPLTTTHHNSTEHTSTHHNSTEHTSTHHHTIV